MILFSRPLVCQAYDLPEQSTVHVVLPPAGSARRSELVLQRRLSRGVDSLTRLDLSASRMPATSTGLAVILKSDDSRTPTGTDTEVCDGSVMLSMKFLSYLFYLFIHFLHWDAINHDEMFSHDEMNF